MKSFLFITDFDGTVTAQDFFLQIMYRYEHNKAFLNENKKGIELLSDVFEGSGLTEKEFEEEIRYIPMDPSFGSFCSFVEKIGGDVLILSAGSSYYIEKKLRLENIKSVKVIANGGAFKDGKFKFLVNENREFFCPIYGIDKEKLVRHYKKEYEKIAYAGDSFIDFKACSLVDFKFAKKKLAEILNMLRLEFYEFANFEEIRKKLIKLFNI